MRVQIKELRYWKTEHLKEGCQDAYNLEASKGLFVVADGAGTTLFPAIWAQILVEQFIRVPLMSKNAYEVEWWVRQAQETYKVKIPDMAHLRDWSIQQKALSQSSDSTLATVRIVASDTSSAQAELLVFGDSCVIIGNRETKEIHSFVLDDPAQFSQPPVCIPSLLKGFNRDFHTCSTRSETLGSEHIVIIASDAVSKWIVGGGAGRFADNEHESKAWQAFQAVNECTDDTWPVFIEECRIAKEMVNDDSTALILDLKEEGKGEGVPLGITTQQFPEVVQRRQAAFENVRREGNNELVALYYGDGTDLKSLVLDVTDEEISHAREVADALKEVFRAFRKVQGTPGLVAKMQPVWDRYRSTLLNEKCAENIRETLQRNGIRLTPPPPEPVQPPAQSSNATTSTDHGRLSPAAKNLQDAAALQTQYEKQAREIAFLKAYGDSHTVNNDEILLAAVKELRNMVPDYQFSEPHRNKIAEVESRVQALERLRKAFRDGDSEKIVEAAHNLPTEVQGQLTANELEHIRLAYAMRAAFKNDDNEILRVSEEISLHENQCFFQFTEDERERIRLAQHRREALNKLQDEFKGGRLRQIVSNYDAILDGSQQLTQTERTFLQLSQEFVEAFDANDDFALTEVYKKIKQFSLYDQIAFTQGEHKHIEQAEQSLQAWLALTKEIVAQVKSRDITLELIRKTGIIRRAIYDYWIKRYRLELTNIVDEVSGQDKSQEIAKFQEYINFRSIAGNILDELINDILIQQELKESAGETAFQNENDVKSEELSRFTFFQTVIVSDYAAFLKKNRLIDEDVTYTCEMDARSQFFRHFFERQQQQKKALMRVKMPMLWKPKQFDEWLESRRREVIYFNYASDPKQRALWMADRIGWKE